MNPRLLVVAAILASCWCPAAALAAPGTDADRATARALSAEAHAALDRKDYKIAADRFTRADALVHAPTLQLGLAQAQVGLGAWIAAQETYARILREGVAPGSPPPFFKALTQARAELDALLARMPSVILEVKGPALARVTLDGVEVQGAALGVNRPVDPGDHVIRAEAEGFTPIERRMRSVAGRGERVELELTGGAPSSASSGASRPDEGSGSPQKTLGIVVLGVGVVGIGVGVATGIIAIGKHDDLAAACTLAGGRCPQSKKDELAGYTTMGALSTAGLIAGSALAAGGVILLITAPRAKTSTGAWVAPVIGAGWAGARGAF